MYTPQGQKLVMDMTYMPGQDCVVNVISCLLCLFIARLLAHPQRTIGDVMIINDTTSVTASRHRVRLCSRYW